MRRLALGCLVLVLLPVLLPLGHAFAAPASAPGGGSIPETSLYPRRKMAVAFHLSGSKLQHLDLTELISQLAATSSATTDLRPEPLPDASVAPCLTDEERAQSPFHCLVTAALLEAKVTPPIQDPEALEALKARLVAPVTDLPTYLLLVSARPSMGKDVVRATLIDTRAAARVIYALERPAGEMTDDLYQQIGLWLATKGQDEDPVVPARPADITSPDQLRAYLRQLFSEGSGGGEAGTPPDSFQEILERAGAWRPYGDLLVEGGVAGVEIYVDGALIGAMQGPRHRLRGLRAGSHELVLRHPELEVFTARVEVRRGAESVMQADLRPNPKPVAQVMNGALLWGGAVVAAAGVGVLAYGVHEGQRVGVRCLHACPEGRDFARLGGDLSQPNPNGTGLPIAPLGWGLAGMGLTWALSNALLGDDTRVPWVEVVLGLAVFGAGLGLGVALDPIDVPR